MILISDAGWKERYDFLVKHKKECKEAGVYLADTFFPVDEFGHVHPSGIVNTSMKFSWYCPGGKIWEIQNVVQIFLYKNEEKYISQIRNEQILEDYNEELFDSLIFFEKSSSNFKSRFVIIPTNFFPSVIGTPEILNFAIRLLASSSVLSGDK
mgnify:CR=1 FL=1